MAKTQADLVVKALAILGVLEANQAPSAEDEQTMNGYVTSTVEMLSSESIVDISDLTDIDASLFVPLAKVLAENAASEFGRDANEGTIMSAKNQIRLIVRNRPTYETLSSSYF